MRINHLSETRLSVSTSKRQRAEGTKVRRHPSASSWTRSSSSTREGNTWTSTSWPTLSQVGGHLTTPPPSARPLTGTTDVQSGRFGLEACSCLVKYLFIYRKSSRSKAVIWCLLSSFELIFFKTCRWGVLWLTAALVMVQVLRPRLTPTRPTWQMWKSLWGPARCRSSSRPSATTRRTTTMRRWWPRWWAYSLRGTKTSTFLSVGATAATL